MMTNSRTRNATRNIIGGVINKVIALGLPFVIRTIILWKLGSEYLGLSSLFTSILQVLNMAELGFSSAVVFSLYKPMAEGDEKIICALMALYRKIYRVVGVVVLVAGLALMPFLKYLIKGTYPNDINLYVLYAIYLINTVISYLAYAYKSVLLTAAQRQDVISNVDTILSLIRCTIQISILCISPNYYLYIIWNLIFTLIYNFFIAFITKKRYPKYVCKGKLDKEKVSVIVMQIKGLAISKFSFTARNSFDSIVLSSFCGLNILAIYSNYYYVFSAVNGILSVMILAITAGVGNSVATETLDKNYSDFNKFNFYYGWIASWCTVSLTCLYQPFMRIWVGTKMVAPFTTMILFCIYFYITQVGQIRSVYSSAAGIWWEFRYLSIAEMILNLLLNFVLGWFWGMNGVLWATIITVFLVGCIGLAIITFRSYFRCSVREYFLNCLVYVLITIVVGVLTYLICGSITLNAILGFLIKAVICIIIPNVLFLIIYMCNRTYRGYLLELKNRLSTLYGK
jgi:O-antigen/teichoic acid export membrane protein